jgi:hypothetical protein
MLTGVGAAARAVTSGDVFGGIVTSNNVGGGTHYAAYQHYSLSHKLYVNNHCDKNGWTSCRKYGIEVSVYFKHTVWNEVKGSIDC